MARTLKYYLSFILLLGSCFCILPTAYCQLNTVDSLNLALKNAKHDTAKLRLLVQLSEECDENDILKNSLYAVELADNLLKQNFSSTDKIRKRILYQKAFALNNIGVFYNSKSDIPMALNYYSKGLKIQEEIGDKAGMAFSLNNLGVIYYNQGDIPKALNYYGNSLKIHEEIGNKYGIATSLHNIGQIYKNQGDLSKALNYYTRSLKIREDIGNQSGIALSLNNIGVIYFKQGNIIKALDYYSKSLKIKEKIGDKSGIANTLNNIGTIYIKQGDFNKALDYFNRSMHIQQEIDDKHGLAYSLNDVSLIYFKQKKYSLAFSLSDSSLTLSKKLGFPENIRNAEERLSKIDSARGNYAAAFEHYKQFIIYRDSINNEQTRKASIKNQLKYEYEKKEAVMKEQQEKERTVAAEKNRFQLIILRLVSCVLLLVAVFAAFIYQSLKTTRKQKIIIEEKQKEILDSIHYAKRIQTALMPNEKYIEKSLNRLRKFSV